MSGVTCVLNAAAGPGHGARVSSEVAALFAAAGVVAQMSTVHAGDDVMAQFAAVARAAAACGQVVVAGGGDGTVSAAAAALAGTGVVLGVLPMGTCNHFARDLGLPLDLPGSVHTIVAGRVRSVDLGEVNGHIFINNSSLGAYPQLVRGRMAEQKHGHRKWVALAIAAAALLRHRPALLEVRLRLDGQAEIVRRTPLLFVGNNQYGMAGGRSRLDGGRLWVCAARETGFARIPMLAVRAMAGHLRARDLDL